MYNVSANNRKLTEGTAAIRQANITDTGWCGFLDALGMLEASGVYNARNGAFHGMYEIGQGQITYMRFFDHNGMGRGFLGVNDFADFENNPIAQELAGVMMFSGIPNVIQEDPYFVSRYRATRIAFGNNAQFNSMIGQSFNITFTDISGNVLATRRITFTQAGISAAAHLVGQGDVAGFMREIYDACFTNGVLTTYDVTLTNAYADANGISCVTYMELLGEYDISDLIAATGGQGFDERLASFAPFVNQIIEYRRDKIIEFISSNNVEIQMNLLVESSNPNNQSNNFSDIINSILQGLSLTGYDLNTISSDDSAGRVVIFSGNNSIYTDGNDLIIGLNGNSSQENSNGNTFNGGNGSDTFMILGQTADSNLFNTFIGGEGTDSIQGGDEDDTIRVESLLKETHSIEVIDGGGGTNVLAGTDSANTLELLETEIRNIRSIELQGGQDTLRLGAQSIGEFKLQMHR